jgi:phage virion morphogenesis protein
MIGGPAIKRRLDRLGHLDTVDLLEVVGATAESQVRRRLSDEKTAPDGSEWPALSEDYAAWKKKRSSGGLLQLYGHLTDSIQFEVRGDEVLVGSNVDYAATHNYGDTREAASWSGAGRSGGKVASATHTVTFPARTFLGLSDENKDELEQVVADWLRDELGFVR